MNITVQKAQNGEQMIEIALTELEMEQYYNQAIQKISTKLNVKGFRPGKIPREVVEQQVEKDYINSTAIDLALPVTYTEALEKEKIEAIGRPEIKIIAPSPLKYEAKIPLYPDVTVANLEKIKLKKNAVELAPDEVENEIKRMAKYHSTFKEVERAAQMGDRADVDFTGFDEGGAQLEGTLSKNHPVLIGEKTLIPGFEEELIGLSKDSEKEFWITFPADYHHQAFQNKKVRFTVKVNRVEEVVPPPISDLILKVTGQTINEEDFRKLLNDNLSREKEATEDNRLENELLEEILKNTKVKIPHSLIDDEIHYMVDQQKQNVESKGMNWEEYLKSKNLAEEKFHDQYHPEAEKRLTLRFGVQQVFKELKVEVTEEEAQKAWENEQKILASLNYSPTDFDLENIKTRLKNKLKMEKLVAHFIK